MTPGLIMTVVALYSILLFVVVWITSRNADNASYFIGNKSSRWYIVAYGMIGASLSGVTFMSVPGAVFTTEFSYMQVVFGYIFGYAAIALIIMPVYYRMNLTSIYTYLEERFGNASYKTGSFFFILSRTIGASFRLYIVINVLQTFVFDAWGVPFIVTVATFMLLILLYTYQGGVKTIVWTDTLQTTFMLVTVVFSVITISGHLGISLGDLLGEVMKSDLSAIYVGDILSPNYFWKNFLGGAFIAIAMTGLDQEMMQKNISVRTLKDSQKNMVTFSFVIVIVNLLFLFLGGLLYLFAAQNGIVTVGDDLFPTIALQHLPEFVSIIFIIGLISALFPSADGAITALTSSFCIDILGLKRRTDITESAKMDTRKIVHITFAVVFMICVLGFKMIDNKSIITVILKVAGYTYGPLLGLFSFGILTRRKVKEYLVPVICIAAPVVCYLVEKNQASFFGKFQIGIELLILNGLLTFTGLYLISSKDNTATAF